jgi:Tol biopolymer transport system component
LMDFGAGQEYSGASVARSDVMGTPLYMAPELFTGGVADQRTDIYALGALLYYLATRTFPVTGRSLIEIRDAHARGERARLRDVRPDLPAPFVKAIEQATAANPSDRFATAGDLEAALDAAMRGTPTVEAAVPTTGRWRLAAVLAVAAVAVIAIAATWRSGANLLGGGNAAPAQGPGAATVTARKLSPPAGVWGLSNPSDDGRFAAASTMASSDAAIVDLTAGTFRALGIQNADQSNGYASITTLSPDGNNIAVAWYVGDKGSIHVIRADGSGHRVLVDDAADVNVYQWSRDGSLILAVISQPDGTNSISLVAEADGAVRRVHTLGTEFPELMTLSPDARYVAYDYPQPGSDRDRDIFVLDTHTGTQWPVAASPAQDTSPLWSPDGDAIVFFSDRNRELAAWMVPMANGRPQAEPHLVKTDVGRVWPRGFTRDGVLHYELTVGFAEVFVGAIDGASTAAPEPMSPRQALSNFYPKWSPDGRFIAYTSERRADGPRELWVYDTTTRQEHRVPSEQKLGVAFGWSPDSRRILSIGQSDARLYAVDRVTGETQLVSRTARRGRWLPEGIVAVEQKKVLLLDANSYRQIRSLDFSDPGILSFELDAPGRTALALWKNGRITATDVVTGSTREWAEPGLTRVGFHAVAPRSSAVAYTAIGKDATGNWVALKVASGDGAPRELLRARGERIVVHGWTADGLSVLVARWVELAPDAPPPTRMATLWRVPVSGAAPVSTGLTMDAIRDVSVHPDGRRIAFNAGFKRSEHWVLENLLAR